MTDHVKTPKRAYRSTKRAEQVAQTRRDILASAGTLFRAQGYTAVAMPVIAREAGVGVETIYRAFGSKAGLFKAVIDAAVAGGSTRAERPVEERPAIRAVIEEPDPRRQVERYAATQPGIHRRSGPLLRALSGAAATDPELAALWREIETSRLEGQGRFVGMLAARGVSSPTCRSRPRAMAYGRSPRLRSMTCSSSREAGASSATNDGWRTDSSTSCWAERPTAVDPRKET